MARTYARDARGRFASKGAANLTATLRGAAKAPKRLEFLRTYHGTDAAAARSIRQGGYRPSAGGALGPGVYTSTSKATARLYANAMSPPGKASTGQLVRHRIHKPAIAAERDSWKLEQARLSGRPVRDMGGKLGIVLLDKATADRTMIREQGIVRGRRRRRR